MDDAPPPTTAASGEEITQDDYLPGFRMQFYERYESMKKAATKHYGLAESDFPSYKGPRYQDDTPSFGEDKTDTMISTDIRNLEMLLKELTESYRRIEDDGGDYVSLEKLKSRIHDCKRKLQMLKNRQKQK